MVRHAIPVILGIAAVTALVAVPRVTLSPAPTPPRASTPVEVTELPGLTARASFDRSAADEGGGDRFLVVEVKGQDLPSERRDPVQLALVVDTSPSMGSEGKIENAKKACGDLIRSLSPDDVLCLVTFDGDSRTPLPCQPVRDREEMAGLVDGLELGSATNVYAGLESGIAALDRVEPPRPPGWGGGVGGKNGPGRRLLLVSDGETNTGITDPDAIAALARNAQARGVTVSTLGLGVSFNDLLMSAVADAGGGRYLYAGKSTDLLDRVAGELDVAGRIAAHGVRIHVDLSDDVQILEVYGSATPQGSDADVLVGDLAAGQVRKVVMRVHAPTGATASIGVSTRDAGESSLSATLLPPGPEPEPVAWATEHAGRAVGGHALDEANAYYRTSDVTLATRTLDRALRELREMKVKDPGLQDKLREQAAAMKQIREDSYEGRDFTLSSRLSALGYVN